MSHRFPQSWCPLQRLSFKVGKPVSVQLENLMGSGYMWAVDFPEQLGRATIPLSDADVKPEPNLNTLLVGGAKPIDLMIQPKQTGKGILRLTLQRPFENTPLEQHEWNFEVFP